MDVFSDVNAHVLRCECMHTQKGISWTLVHTVKAVSESHEKPQTFLQNIHNFLKYVVFFPACFSSTHTHTHMQIVFDTHYCSSAHTLPLARTLPASSITFVGRGKCLQRLVGHGFLFLKADPTRRLWCLSSMYTHVKIL